MWKGAQPGRKDRAFDISVFVLVLTMLGMATDVLSVREAETAIDGLAMLLGGFILGNNGEWFAKRGTTAAPAPAADPVVPPQT
jgi:hypothetical protein